MLPAGLTGIAGVIARYTITGVFHKLATKYQAEDAAAHTEQVSV